MKVSSKVEICNLALARIELNSISSYEDDNSAQAQFCRMSYEQSKSSLLGQYNWTFAISRAKLKELENENDDFNEYEHKYSLPSDFLRLVMVYNESNHPVIHFMNYKAPFVMEGRHIYTDVENAKIKYIRDVDDVSEFSPLFIDCLILDLAVRLTRLFNSSTTMLQQLLSEFTLMIEKAKITDCQQTTSQSSCVSPILASTWGF